MIADRRFKKVRVTIGGVDNITANNDVIMFDESDARDGDSFDNMESQGSSGGRAAKEEAMQSGLEAILMRKSIVLAIQN